MKGPWQVGDRLQPLVLDEVTHLELIKYAGASGDYNPIHMIDEEAAKAGLPGVISHGMLTMAKMGCLLTPYLDQGYIRQFKTRFVGMVFVGDRLTIEGEVVDCQTTASSSEAQKTVYTFKLRAINQEGKEVATGKAVFDWFGKVQGK